MSDFDLNRKLDALIERADSIDANLETDKQERARENKKRDRRIRYSQNAIALALAIAAFSIISARIQHDNDLRDSNKRRISFCRSLEDVGAASEAAANGSAEGTLKTFFDPAISNPDAPPTPQATIDLFTQLLRKYTKDSVHAATVVEIDSVKAKNGFTPDCRVLTPISASEVTWYVALILLCLLFIVFLMLLNGFLLVARRVAKNGDGRASTK